MVVGVELLSFLNAGFLIRKFAKEIRNKENIIDGLMSNANQV